MLSEAWPLLDLRCVPPIGTLHNLPPCFVHERAERKGGERTLSPRQDTSKRSMVARLLQTGVAARLIPVGSKNLILCNARSAQWMTAQHKAEEPT